MEGERHEAEAGGAGAAAAALLRGRIEGRKRKENLIERRRVMAPSRYWQFPVTGEGERKGGREGRKPQSGLEKKREGRLGLTDARMRKEGGEGGNTRGSEGEGRRRRVVLAG